MGWFSSSSSAPKGTGQQCAICARELTTAEVNNSDKGLCIHCLEEYQQDMSRCGTYMKCAETMLKSASSKMSKIEAHKMQLDALYLSKVKYEEAGLNPMEDTDAKILSVLAKISEEAM